jgi:hypothetical protein
MHPNIWQTFAKSQKEVSASFIAYICLPLYLQFNLCLLLSVEVDASP